MGTVTRQLNIGYIQNNDTYEIEVDIVVNQSSNIVGGVKVALTIPGGVAFNNLTTDQGVFVAGPNEWQIGTLLPGQSLTGTFEFIVTDESLNPFEHVFVLTATEGCVACFADDRLEVTVDGVGCSNVQSCLSSLAAYDDDAAAAGGGVAIGELYQTTGSGAAPLNIAGLIKIRTV